MTRFVSIIALVVLALSASAQGLRPVHIRCEGLDSWVIEGTLDVDWMWGTMRSPGDVAVIAFAAGGLIEEAVPARRPPGFRTFETEKIGAVTLRHGLHVRRREYRATLTGASLGPRLNLLGRSDQKARVLGLARLLASASCSVSLKEQ